VAAIEPPARPRKASTTRRPDEQPDHNRPNEATTRPCDAGAGGFLLLAPSGLAQAAPGDLDPTFDTDGKLAIDDLGSDYGESVVLQPDRKIVIAGYGDPEVDFTVTRLHPDGAFDDGFSAFGTFKVTFGEPADYGRAAALQADGKIVVAGFTPSTTTSR